MDIIIRHKFWAIIVLKCFMSLNSSFNAIIPKSFKTGKGRGEAYDRSNEIQYVRCMYEYHVVSSLNATILNTQPFPNVVRCSLFISILRKIENNLSNKGLVYNRLRSIFLEDHAWSRGRWGGGRGLITGTGKLLWFLGREGLVFARDLRYFCQPEWRAGGLWNGNSDNMSYVFVQCLLLVLIRFVFSWFCAFLCFRWCSKASTAESVLTGTYLLTMCRSHLNADQRLMVLLFKISNAHL